MAVVDTSRSSSEYQFALAQLLPPGEYWQGNSADNITNFQAQELARIHAEIDTKLKFNIGDTSKGWTLMHYELICAEFGLTDFIVKDKIQLPMQCGASVGAMLGHEANIYKVYIYFKPTDEHLVLALAKYLQTYKLVHQIIILHTNKPRLSGEYKAGVNTAVVLR